MNSVQLELAQVGLEVEFFPLAIEVKDDEWEGVSRRYWHGRTSYYLPHARLTSATPASAVDVAPDEPTVGS